MQGCNQWFAMAANWEMPIDLHFNAVNACVEALVVPGPTKLWTTIKGEREGYTIPWSRIRRIGDDVILVELEPDFFKC